MLWNNPLYIQCVDQWISLLIIIKSVINQCLLCALCHFDMHTEHPQNYTQIHKAKHIAAHIRIERATLNNALELISNQ